jgi:superfamily II DNA or RNA helicase
MKLNHLSTKSVAEANVFQNLTSYEDMMKSIMKYGKAQGKDGYDAAVGAAFEVYTEFFFKRYGTQANPQLNVLFIEDTSQNKYEAGIDFRYRDFSGLSAIVQSKFRSIPTYKFKRSDLGTFVSVCDEEDIVKSNRILFTSLEYTSQDTIFHYSWPKGHTQMRVIGRNHQEGFIERDLSFWSDFQSVVEQALKAPVDFKKAPDLWEHQIKMNDAVKSILNDGGNGRVICATGGGKTRVIYQNVMDGFDKGFNVQVVVAPTIDLLRQHHAYFEQYGAFHREGVSVIHFRTGEECKDGWADVYQTTSPADAIENFKNKTLVFVTYASEEKLFDGLRSKECMIDAVYWDEFHHTVRQNINQREHLLSIPSERNLFYSASIKRGRVVSGMDEEVYGPILCEVKYSELRKTGILVPRIRIKTIFISQDKIKHITSAMKKAAKRDNFDLKTGVTEAAGSIAALRDMIASGRNCNAVTFSKAVAICKEIVSNDEIRGEFNCELQTVHAGIPGYQRKKIYENVNCAKNSVLCQYSVVKEGIDINPFNCVIFSRNMDVIGTQQALGRAVRANPEDTKNLKAGKISIDSSEGWNKYDATVYVIMHLENADSFKEFLKDLVMKLQFAGLEEDDFEFADVSEERHGTEDDDNSWIIPMDKLSTLINVKSVKEAVKAALLEEEEQILLDELLIKYKNLSLLELI